jgi:hypothetical protein
MAEPHVTKASAKYNSEAQQWYIMCRLSDGEQVQAAAISSHGGDVAHYLAVALPGVEEVPDAGSMMKTGTRPGEDLVYEVAPPGHDPVFVTVVVKKPDLARRIGGLLVMASEADATKATPSD